MIPHLEFLFGSVWAGFPGKSTTRMLRGKSQGGDGKCNGHDLEGEYEPVWEGKIYVKENE